MSLPALPCYLNGRFSTTDQATVSVLDRGFIFGDGVYEVVPFYQGRPFRLAQHLARLQRSLDEVRITNPHTLTEWETLLAQLVQQLAAQVGQPAEAFHQTVYLQVTRGAALRDHVISPGLTPTVFAYANRFQPPADSVAQQGVRCVSADDFRWEKAHIKSTSLMGAILARDISHQADAAETILFRQGRLSEASASNVWIVKNGQVLGVPKDHLVLEGIRFGVVEELCRELAIPFALRPITREEVLAADEVFLTSATREVLPVIQIDAQRIGNGAPGPVALQLRQAYQRATGCV